jgi:hypothetical protein
MLTFLKRRRRAAPRLRSVPAVTIEQVGREHSGKSVLVDSLYPAVVRPMLGSGLTIGAGDPRLVARMMLRWRKLDDQVRLTGRQTTIRPELSRLRLFENDQERARLQIRDSVGQVLTRTPVAATGERAEAYDAYLAGLAVADVLWLVVPCLPKLHTREDLRRIRDDLTLTMAYAQHVLRQRDRDHPCAVALVLSRVDVRYDSETALRRLLPCELLAGLRTWFRGVTDLPAVTDAAIFPVSAFGFGVAQELPAAKQQRDDLTFGEKEWILRQGAEQRPYNVAPLFVWSLLAALQERPADDGTADAEDLARVCRLLRDDLAAMPGWHRIRGYFFIDEA